MQEYQDKELISKLTGDLKELSSRVKRRMEKGEITHAVIGKLPHIGQEIEINGLKFEVFNVLNSSGKVFLKMKG